MPEELNFSDFIADSAETPDAEAQDETRQDDVSEVTESSEVSEESVESGQEQVAPSDQVPASITFEDKLRERGFDIPDELDRGDLYANAVDKIAEGQLALKQLSELQAKLEALEAQQASPSTAPSTQTSESIEPEKAPQSEEVVSTIFRQLQKPDSSLYNLVQVDDSGNAVPKDGIGAPAWEAAQKINEYNRLEREQAERLLSNPHLIFEDTKSQIARLAEEKAQALFENRFSEWEKKQEEARQQQQSQAAQFEEEKRLNDWHEQHKSELFQLDANGNVLSVFGDGKPSRTAMGNAFFERYSELSQKLPGVPDLQLRDLAYEHAKLSQPALQQQVEQVKQPVQTQLEKKQQFAQQRQEVPHQNTPQATASEAIASQGGFRFSDMARRIPENSQILGGQ